MDIRTLQYWHKLEHFYPYILQPQKHAYIKTYLTGDGSGLPDFEQPEIEPGMVVRGYCIYLGIFKVEPALAALEGGIGRKMRFLDCGDDESCFCMFKLNPDGSVRPESFQISSFPWAIHRVRDGKINVDQWDEDFSRFQKQIFSVLEEREYPVDIAFLVSLRDLFANCVNWRIQYCSDWLRIDRIIGQEQPAKRFEAEPKVTEDDIGEEENIRSEDLAVDEQVEKNNLLNSFYIRDLERIISAVQESKYQEPFRRFLEHQSTPKIDIEHDSDALFQLMAPRNLPKGRWPSDYGARLMQQVDVNAFLSEDEEFRQSLFSVNGPPGTGKTTLLKDVVAAIVTQRAIALLSLKSPNDAFNPQQLDTIIYKERHCNVWQLRPEFKCFSILVASNNNGAVENITHGLPGRKDIPKRYDTQEYRYFAQVSDRLLGQEQTWALNAAAMGKKSNRQAFIKNFWPINKEEEEPFNLRTTLWETTRAFTPDRWVDAKQRFSEQLAAVEAEFNRVENIYSAVEELRTLKKKIESAERDIPVLKSQLSAIKEAIPEAEAALKQAEAQRNALAEEVQYLLHTTPFLGLRELIAPHSPVVQELNKKRVQRSQVSQTADQLRENWENATKMADRAQKDYMAAQSVLASGQRRLVELQAMLEAFRLEVGLRFRPDEFFDDCGSGEHGKFSPWGYQKLNELREQLYLSAMNLHRVFVESSSHLRDNLDGFNKLMREMLPRSQTSSLMAPLLQSLFLVVPVISTTFASIGTFLRDIPAGEIAYLFIDEAGQAVPQSAAGAIWRARKVIAVGDPLQIEPVVTLHDAVIEALGRHFEQPLTLTDKYTSVQTLADLSNRLGGWRQVNEPGDLWIGAPLLVHSRCQRRVFDIANRIAYNNKMVFDTKTRAGAICQWLNVRGSSQTGHYVPAQAESALPLVAQAFENFIASGDKKNKYPSIFVITPFRSSRAGLLAYFRKELLRCLAETGLTPKCQELRKIIQDWLKDCVGTIHTFQGKEADTVLLCLGVDSDGKGNGAVDWAGERPNILNVAVTRARERLYIIADHDVWCRKGYFQTAWEFCDKRT